MAKQNTRVGKMYARAWRKLNKATPLRDDCGKLCGKKCCSGSEGDGMLLFPGEETLYRNQDTHWFHIKDSHIILPGGANIKLLVCNGNCPRELRPLSCRIFPLTPYMNDSGRIDFRLDWRGLTLCPLVFHPDTHPLCKRFIEKVYRTFPCLLRESEVIELIRILSMQYDESMNFLQKIHGVQT